MDVRFFDMLFCVNWFLNLLNTYSMNYKEYQRIMQLFQGVYTFAVDYFGMDEVVSFIRVKRNIPQNKFIVNTKINLWQRLRQTNKEHLLQISPSIRHTI